MLHVFPTALFIIVCILARKSSIANYGQVSALKKDHFRQQLVPLKAGAHVLVNLDMLSVGQVYLFQICHRQS